MEYGKYSNFNEQDTVHGAKRRLLMKVRVATITLTLLLMLASGCAIVHRYGPYYGKVADAETKEPLEGAAVLVECNTQSYGPGGSNDNYVDAQETVTDKNGEFRIPAFTIWTFRPLQNFASYVGFTIFKPGYGCFPRHKDVKPMLFPNGSLPAKEYIVIELPKLETKQARLQNYGCYPSELLPEAKYKALFELIQQERMTLGLEPREMPN